MARVLANTKDMTIEEWRKLRKKSIGGSDSATVVGLNNFSSRFKLYADKKSLIPDKEDTEAMRIGRDFEGYVACRFTEATGKKVKKDNHMYLHDDYDFISANIDRRIVGENAGLECKTTSFYKKSDFENGKIPLYYYCQCMHYMAVMGFEKMYLAILVMGKAFYWFEIERNEEEIENLIASEVEFWKDHIESGVMPVADGSEATGEVLKILYPEAFENKESVFLGSNLDILFKTQAEIKELQKTEKKYKNLVIADLKDCEDGYSNSYLVTYKNTARTDIDKEKLKTKYPEIYKECLKKIEYRKMSIKEDK